MMFKKISNIDLSNKIDNIENKIDIINLRLDSQTTEGCCDCKSREKVIYSQIKDYLEEKFNKFTHDITVKLNDKEVINTVFLKYHNEILENIDKIILNINVLKNENSNENSNGNLELPEEFFVKLQNSINLQNNKEFCDIVKNVEDLHTLYMSKMDNQSDIAKNLYDILIKLDNKINMLYFENEIIKHQLLLEEELRKYNDEIDNLKSLIEVKIKDINNVIGTI